ncbi:MAG TPA: LysR substrate-binding domain-containing protein, partial [Bordetella sp.]|nr:LysR substrate-binding domain-containing protein [Bordetella sp.]
AAARELGISQPAVTLLLRELEQVFEAVLVERDARGARVTPQGHRALERLKIAMSILGQALEAAQAPGTMPTLRAGCVQIVGFTALPDALARLLAQGELGYTRIREGESQGLLRALEAGELDCAVAWLDDSTATAVDLDRFSIEPLWSGQMRVFAAAGHPLARRRQVSISELAQWPWVVPNPGSRTHAAFERLFLNGGMAAPRPRLVCSSVHSGAHIVAAGSFLGIAPDNLIARYRESLSLRILRGDALALAPIRLSFFALKDAAAFEPVTRFREALQAACIGVSR